MNPGHHVYKKDNYKKLLETKTLSKKGGGSRFTMIVPQIDMKSA